jgi:drug/metabolite transporter (DMT)-like permease
MHELTKHLWRDGLASSTAVAMTAALRSRMEGRSVWRPINAISHIVWGRHAAKQTEPTLRYTGMGLLLNVAACVFWAGCYHAWRRMTPKSDSVLRAASTAVWTSALAYIIDYHLVPRRFTPGFELSLSRRSFPWVYTALAVGLLLPDRFNRSRNTKA